MDNKKNTIQTITDSIREFATDSILSDGPGIGELTSEFIKWCNDTSPPLQNDAAFRADIVLSFNSIAKKTTDIQTVQHCLQAMIRSGRFGRIVSGRFILAKTVSLHKLDAKISSWPVRDRLAIAHEMLNEYPGDNDKKTLTWLENLLKPLMATDPVELAPFVAELGETGETLAFPVKQAVMGGLLGRWINTRLSNGTHGAELHQICMIIKAIDDASYAEALAKSVELKHIQPDVEVLRTIATVGEAGKKTILTMLFKTLSDSSNGLSGACLDAIIAQNHPGLGKLLASVRTQMPSLKKGVISRIPLLGDTGYADYIQALPNDQQMDAHLEALGVLEAIAPDFVRNVTKQCMPRGQKIHPKGSNSFPVVTPKPKNETVGAQQGFFTKFFKSKPKTLESVLPKYRNIRDMSLPNSHIEDEDLDGRDLTKLNLTGSMFSKTRFIRTKVTNSTLNDTVFFLCQCTASTFNSIDFTDTQFAKTTFSGCTFTNCTFFATNFDDCTFLECRFHDCSFGNASFQRMKMRKTDFGTGSLAGTTIHDCSIRTTRFKAMDLTFSEFVHNDLRGVEFINSVLHAVYIRDCTLASMEMPGTTVTRSIIKNSDVAHPLFLANRIRQMTLFAREVEKGIIPKTSETDPFLAQKALTIWSQELTLMRRERRMLDNNRTRISRAITTMGRTQQEFIRILPLLLDTDNFERKFNFGETPICRVWGYYPSLSTLEIGQQHLNRLQLRPTAPDVRILALYAMGSTGTVAQTAQSDFDCWVCYDGDLTIAMENGLKRKLEAIALWAESEFGLETHFYPMRMDDVRDNRFLSGDEESSGSAQVLLLKEEFYRTALKIAGRSLAWWIVPAGANRKTYDACIRASRRYPVCGKPRLEDFGYLAPVPPDEYFGGSLWQMVKAVHAPFKSVLKLGLLETYAAPGISSLPLCERIKHNIVGNRRGKLDTDPYTALFTTLHDYYLKRNENNAAALLKESFRLKANLSNVPFFMNLPTRPEDESLISVLFGVGYVEPDRIAGVNRSWSFSKSLKMGSRVRQYMVDTYQRIQSGLSTEGATKAHINSEDLTRMGRRIGANFSRKAHKIMRVPFMDTTENGFPILHFSAIKHSHKPPVWVVRGGSAVEAKQSAEALQLLHRNVDPVRMLAWLLANRIYHPKSLLQADRSIAPISVADLQKLMPALHSFFPFDTTFERDINEGLNPEQVTRAFFILNLTTPHDTRRIDKAAVVYATNWGEMYCRTFVHPGQMFETTPSLFLAQKLDQPIIEKPEMSMFLPKGSQCKRITLV
nr:class I adenylate cyclase [uncultured Pseudodesulfovibrio sp.]